MTASAQFVKKLLASKTAFIAGVLFFIVVFYLLFTFFTPEESQKSSLSNREPELTSSSALIEADSTPPNDVSNSASSAPVAPNEQPIASADGKSADHETIFEERAYLEEVRKESEQAFKAFDKKESELLQKDKEAMRIIAELEQGIKEK